MNFLWIVLIAYGIVMFLASPTARRFGEFFASKGPNGREIGPALLTSSVVISWIFAKSITNASNLGAQFGFVGAVSYAGWYLSIPVAGVIIYLIRRRTGAASLTEFLMDKYGRAAALGFMLVILLRLINEVWSNTAVVGSYFGMAGTAPYFAAAIVFAIFTLFYSLRGGLRSSIITDAIQFGFGVFLLVFVLALIVPRGGVVPLLSAGEWTLRGGVDLLLVALLQSFSYPFHDPVLTDRAFITQPRVMLRSYLWAGVIAATFISLFGLVGVYASVNGIESGQDSPLRVAQAFGVAVLSMMTVLMMVSAGSTLDSTLASFSRAFVVDVGGRGEDGAHGSLVRRIATWAQNADAIKLGRIAMVVAVVVGSAPLFVGAGILKATTVSGTMVIGLAPAFLLFAWRRAGRLAFHLGFWPGIVTGILYAVGAVPESWYLGAGSYSKLLGANIWGSVAAFGGFAVGTWIDGLARHKRVAAAAGIGIVMLLFTLPGLVHAGRSHRARAMITTSPTTHQFARAHHSHHGVYAWPK